MHLVLLGPPGAGKGTQGELLAHELQLPRIATGDMLRFATQQPGNLGKKIAQIMARGEFISDDIIIALLKTRLKDEDCQRGCIFDGFPRNIEQAQALQLIAKIDQVFEIHTPDDKIVERIVGRQVHLASGRTYHLKFNPPKVANKDDITGEDLIQRADDTVVAVKKRLQIYHQHTKPLIEFYCQLAQQQKLDYCRINGDQSPQQVQQEIRNKLAKNA